MKSKIQHIDIDKYRPTPLEGLFDDREGTLEYNLQQIIFNDLSEADRNLLLASIEFGTQTKLAHELNCSSAIISINLKRIKNLIKEKLKKYDY